MDFDFDDDFIEDLIRMDQNKSDSVESLPTFNPSSPSPHEANMKHFDYFSPNPPSYYLDPTLSQPFETQQFCDKRNINNHNRTLIFDPNEARIDYTYDHPHQTNVMEQTFRKYVQHTIPDELKNLILETNRVWGVKFIYDNQILVDNHIFNMKTKVVNKQEGRFIKWTCATDRCRFSLITVEGRIKIPSRLHQHNKKQVVKKGKHIPCINNDTIELDSSMLNLVYNQNTKQLVTNMSNSLRSSLIWRPWL